MSRCRVASRLLLVATLVAASAGIALAATQTRAKIYRAFTASGTPTGHVTHTYPGQCFSGSDSSRRKDAWRCIISGSSIADPCFSSTKAHGFVLCPVAGPWTHRQIKVTLTKKLPSKLANKGKPSKQGLPWALITTSGWKCRYATGATNRKHGKRQNYFCKGTKDSLWGRPSRRSEPWKIDAGKSNSKKFHRVGIKKAWF